MNKFETDNLTGENHEGTHPNLPLKFLTATSIMADDVMSPEGTHLGEINNIMIDIGSGKIEYIVIELGGFLGIGEKYFAVPFTLLKVDTENHSFILDQTKAALEAAPGFDKDHWPETNSHYASASSYWGGFMGANTGYSPG